MKTTIVRADHEVHAVTMMRTIAPEGGGGMRMTIMMMSQDEEEESPIAAE